ncbi:hypothetical protein TIFTF001_040395 [Ficus carica]|uniref:Uncharacterized protein n=1 Tax=Ficus carica TaxID=3494 RepID=A0AA87ZEA9_FICCA|nr:hypothetical protein TIFTF001_040395 [Ficus carica]
MIGAGINQETQRPAESYGEHQCGEPDSQKSVDGHKPFTRTTTTRMLGIPQVRALGAGNKPPHTTNKGRKLGLGDQPRLTILKPLFASEDTPVVNERQAQPRQTALGTSAR